MVHNLIHKSTVCDLTKIKALHLFFHLVFRNCHCYSVSHLFLFPPQGIGQELLCFYWWPKGSYLQGVEEGKACESGESCSWPSIAFFFHLWEQVYVVLNGSQIRTHKGRKFSKYCPPEGIRYDGIYKVGMGSQNFLYVCTCSLLLILK